MKIGNYETIIPEQSTVEAHPVLFGGGGGGAKKRRPYYSSLQLTYTFKTRKTHKKCLESLNFERSVVAHLINMKIKSEKIQGIIGLDQKFATSERKTRKKIIQFFRDNFFLIEKYIMPSKVLIELLIA